MRTAIHWFRRDLRVTDNPGLAAAAAWAEWVVPVYVVSQWRGAHHWTGSHRQEFLCRCLASLAGNLQSLGGSLVIRQGDAVDELMRLARETRASAIFFNNDPDPFGRGVERRLAETAVVEGIKVSGFQDACLHEARELATAAGGPFRVYSAYARAWSRLAKPALRGRLRVLRTPSGIPSEALPALETWGLDSGGAILAAGERAARSRMKVFLDKGLAAYGRERDRLSGQTSRLSQDLRFGLISIRELYQRCEAHAAGLPASGRKSAEKFIGELVWREFYFSILANFPEVLDVEFQPRFRQMAWPGRPEHFRRWSTGETGFPIVDAAMRQLNTTGFMPNRARMVVAMFLTKDLLLDWRLGEAFFMQKLVDGEIANNNGGWQWSAGTGADAAPYFRIQNPWTQAARHDSEGEYIRTWLPELRDAPLDRLFRPPESGSLVAGYPRPMVDHAKQREFAIELFRRR